MWTIEIRATPECYKVTHTRKQEQLRLDGGPLEFEFMWQCVFKFNLQVSQLENCELEMQQLLFHKECRETTHQVVHRAFERLDT